MSIVKHATSRAETDNMAIWVRSCTHNPITEVKDVEIQNCFDVFWLASHALSDDANVEINAIKFLVSI